MLHSRWINHHKLFIFLHKYPSIFLHIQNHPESSFYICSSSIYSIRNEQKIFFFFRAIDVFCASCLDFLAPNLYLSTDSHFLLFPILQFLVFFLVYFYIFRIFFLLIYGGLFHKWRQWLIFWFRRKTLTIISSDIISKIFPLSNSVWEHKKKSFIKFSLYVTFLQNFSNYTHVHNIASNI